MYATDGTIALDATYIVLNAYGAAILRHEQPTPDRCSRCNSLRITIVPHPDFESGDAIACDACGRIEDAHPAKPSTQAKPAKTTTASKRAPRLPKQAGKTT